MIAETLDYGKENAITGKDLAALFDCDIRIITQQIEKERRDGAPICAVSGLNPGYYLGNSEEIAEYCKRLKHRTTELTKTRQCLIKTLRSISKQREN